MTAVPLRRNRDFMVLQIGQLLSNVGTQLTAIAYPLLVLAVTDSAAKAGIVSFARILPLAPFALPAGLAADRWSRKWLMIAADGVRVLAVGSLAATILLDGVVFWAIALVAFVEGSGAALFSTAQAGALRAVVPPLQLPADAVPRGARARSLLAALASGGGLPLPLGPAVPAHVRAPLRAHELPRPRHPARGRRHRRTARALGRRDRRARLRLRRLPAARLVRVAARPPPAPSPSRPPARALDVAGLRRLPRLAERLRAGREPVDGLGRHRVSDRDHS